MNVLRRLILGEPALAPTRDRTPYWTRMRFEEMETDMANMVDASFGQAGRIAAELPAVEVPPTPKPSSPEVEAVVRLIEQRLRDIHGVFSDVLREGLALITDLRARDQSVAAYIEQEKSAAKQLLDDFRRPRERLNGNTASKTSDSETS